MLKKRMGSLLVVACAALLGVGTTLDLAAQAPRPAPSRAPQPAAGSAYYDELIGNLTRLVKSLQDDNAQLALKVAELDRRMAQLTAQNTAMTQEVAAMRTQVAADTQAREAQLKRLDAQLSKIAETAAQPPPRSGRPAAEPAGPPPGKYQEYVVQQGATLSAIAQAFDVTVRDIMKANNLKNDNLAVGQKLLIPKR